MDTGLCAYLTRWTNSESLEVGAMSGAFFETYVVGEIVKSYYNAGKSPPIYHYRDKDNKEIDIIIEQNQILYPIEVKKSASPSKDAMKHFAVLNNLNRETGLGAVVCLSSELLPLNDNCYIIPSWYI